MGRKREVTSLNAIEVGVKFSNFFCKLDEKLLKIFIVEVLAVSDSSLER